jgi:hypothetical protein
MQLIKYMTDAADARVNMAIIMINATYACMHGCFHSCVIAVAVALDAAALAVAVALVFAVAVFAGCLVSAAVACTHMQPMQPMHTAGIGIHLIWQVTFSYHVTPEQHTQLAKT